MVVSGIYIPETLILLNVSHFNNIPVVQSLEYIVGFKVVFVFLHFLNHDQRDAAQQASKDWVLDMSDAQDLFVSFI